MKWNKKGLIFTVNQNFGWMNSHAQIPTALVYEDKIRIYFSTRPKHGLSLTTFLDLDVKKPENILYIHDKPILDIGHPGTFDEHGIMPSYVFKEKEKIYLFYSGWSRRCITPYMNLTGLAISDDGINFEKISEGPILTINRYEPFSATSPFLLKEKGFYYIFYCSGLGWRFIDDKYEHFYDIKCSVSDNFFDFGQYGNIAIKVKNKNEALTRPSIIKTKDTYHMWYCYRGIEDFRDGKNAYRIGYAYSYDLKTWHRDDSKAGIDLSDEGWDSKMIAYPYVVKTPYGIYMFYNGNGFGKSGFGYAILQIE
jgi:predicted GH43/DUF377 family glycosyl hydrolase